VGIKLGQVWLLLQNGPSGTKRNGLIRMGMERIGMVVERIGTVMEQVERSGTNLIRCTESGIN